MLILADMAHYFCPSRLIDFVFFFMKFSVLIPEHCGSEQGSSSGRGLDHLSGIVFPLTCGVETS